jgi:N-methylhydantoinase A
MVDRKTTIVSASRNNDLVGVDTGGTFTDFVLLDPQGRLTVIKRASTPQDPSDAIAAGVTWLQDHAALRTGYTLVHGTTVATNALLERRGASTALITTAGFRDVLEIGRQARSGLYALHPKKPMPLLPQELRFEVHERADAQGHILKPLDIGNVASVLDAIVQGGVESVAVCLLFSYLNPEHERMIGRMAAERGLSVSLSCDLSPEPREYERTATVVANAYVTPVMQRYLLRLQARLEASGCGLLRVMQSNGGALSAHEAASQAIKTALSGPAGGVIAAAKLGDAAGYSDLLTFDMGGTSTDVALLHDGRCRMVTTGELAGMPLRTPILDIHTVGAGGGSQVRLDAAGGLRVGPQSAGADPGPVAYGKGEVLTVTDANLLLGRMPADILLGGSLALDIERVRSRFAQLAEQLTCTMERAAEGVIAVANAAMARALRHISVERGHDPAHFALLSFGGAGGMHACDLARILGMRIVIVPPYPGAFSALGLILADVRREYVRALSARDSKEWQLPARRVKLAAAFRDLDVDAERDMAADGIADGDWQVEHQIELRYVGQSFALPVPITVDLDTAQATDAFHRVHFSRYGHSDPDAPVEAVALRVGAFVPRSAAPVIARRGANTGERRLHRLYADREWRKATITDRAALEPNSAIDGPCVIVQEDATTYVPPGWRCGLDDQGNMVLEWTQR